MMPVMIGGKPPADFTQPIEMLKDCHRRIEHFLDMLRTVDARFGADNLSDEGRRALEAALHYFADFAPRHTADEEQSLFPRLRAGENSDARAALAELDRLEQDHRRGEAAHARVDALAREWLKTGRRDEAQRQQMRQALDELKTMYDAHIRLEEERVFVHAADLLTEQQVGEIGQEMRRRRSLPNVSR